MKPPCEIVSRYVLPTVRALVAERLLDKSGLTQMDAALKVGLTQSAMSRYLASERGRRIKMAPHVRNLVNSMAEGISKNKLSHEEILERMCHICITLRKSGGLCEFHRRIVPSLSKTCEICSRTFDREFASQT